MLVGRRAETAAIDRLLAAAREGRSGVLVLRGDPGIGKSALLEEARQRASDMVVLSACGVESESELPYAAVHQLVRPALGELEKLPAPQAAALRSALGFEDGGGQQSFLVFAACLSLLSELAEQHPVLCLVDDAHWLDAASADALRFVARRLDAEGIVVLFAAREGDVRRFEFAELPALVLEGLDAADAAELLARGSAVAAAPTVRDRLLERAGGNALALLEVPAALNERQLAGAEPMPDALPLTHELESVFLERVRRLPAETQRLLLVAAADDTENAPLIVRAAQQLGVTATALEAAEAAGLVAIGGGRLDFRHSLVRSAVYAAAPFGDRRAAHRALADALVGDDEHADRRAWHLASALSSTTRTSCARSKSPPGAPRSAPVTSQRRRRWSARPNCPPTRASAAGSSSEPRGRRAWRAPTTSPRRSRTGRRSSSTIPHCAPRSRAPAAWPRSAAAGRSTRSRCSRRRHGTSRRPIRAWRSTCSATPIRLPWRAPTSRACTRCASSPSRSSRRRETKRRRSPPTCCAGTAR